MCASSLLTLGLSNEMQIPTKLVRKDNSFGLADAFTKAKLYKRFTFVTLISFFMLNFMQVYTRQLENRCLQCSIQFTSTLYSQQVPLMIQF
jgi:hypothetical protein